ncbi:MAG: UDP-N-acetylmuramoyl-tripeptide--D-alanyl-D-alanine ligase [Saprospiraceae bacterium]
MNTAELYHHYLSAQQCISTDSRQIKPGCLFFALKGDNFDGNQFAARAIDEGAVLAIIDDPSVHLANGKTILVNNVLETLQTLATHHRRQFHIPIIGITGSNGKTTTKELIAGVLKTHYQTHFTRGNYNNHIGVPLTLLEMPLDTEVAVIEMGANHQGEIDLLSRIAEPSHGIITNIGKAHLEGFGGIEGVKKGKSELYRFLGENRGTVFINRDAAFLTELAAPVANQIFYFQTKNPSLKEPGYETVLLEDKPFLKVGYLDKDATLVDANTYLFGMHNFQNIMTAISIGKYFKVPAGKIKYALENYIPSDNRSQLMDWENDNKILLDAYNANPSSMEASLRLFASQIENRTPLAILGDMLELGKDAAQEHLNIASLAVELLGPDHVVLVGPLFKDAAKQFNLLHFSNTPASKQWFDAQNWSAHYFLLKGSRGIGLEKLLAVPTF